ncbi:MAG: ATP-binding protein [Eubacteriaceae bacterium]|nr:ATP-binding protein [Eubacteriaceae bacterium]
MHVLFPLVDIGLDLPEGTKVSEACDAAGYPLNLVCGGKGKCKKCVVNIEEDGVAKEVLGCVTDISDGMKIFVSPEKSDSQILETLLEGVGHEPKTKVYPLLYEDLVTPLCGYDLNRIRTLIDQPIDKPSYTSLKKLSEVYHLESFKYLNVVMYENQIADFVPSNEEIPLYGVAFDIGTTTVVGFLFDLKTGVMLDKASQLNEQISYGADVISRIDAAGSSEEKLERLHLALMETINKIIDALCKRVGIAREHIYDNVYCGNSTMQYLFMKINPKHLGISPFTSFSPDTVVVSAEELEIEINPMGRHTFLPLLGSFVGADTTAVLMNLPRDGKNRLMIDLGTNGEIAVGNYKRFFVSSTACGPALEGAGLTMGMRGTTGAIEKVTCEDNQIKVQVIGDVAPVGICGSGIVDAVAVLFREGIIAKRGNFIKGDALDAHPLKDRMRVIEDGIKAFALVTEEESSSKREILISQKDIRSVQLAKSAIYTGCKLLVESFGIASTELEEITLAGAFGNYIDVDNAQYIGLIPKVEGVPVRSIGNGAGLGAQMYLVSKTEADICDAIPTITTHIELATDPAFTSTYMLNTYFEEKLMD